MELLAKNLQAGGGVAQPVPDQRAGRIIFHSVTALGVPCKSAGVRLVFLSQQLFLPFFLDHDDRFQFHGLSTFAGAAVPFVLLCSRRKCPATSHKKADFSRLRETCNLVRQCSAVQ